MRRAAALVLAAMLSSSCAASLMKLPAGPGTPAANAPGALAESTAACQRVQTVTAEIAVSGSVNGQRLRARLTAGLAPPDSTRLEASALGQKLFVFVSRANDATLLLQRDNRILEHGPPGAILEAVTGVPLDPTLLRTTVTGCANGLTADAAHQFGEDWMSVPDGNGTVYLQRTPHNAPWRLVAAIRHDRSGAEWTAEYREIVDGVPRDIRLRSAPDGMRFNLKLVLTQVETNETLDAAAFRVTIPASAGPLTLNELRESGPLGAPARPGPNNSGTK